MILFGDEQMNLTHALLPFFPLCSRYTVIPKVLYVRRWGFKRWGLAFGPRGKVTYH